MKKYEWSSKEAERKALGKSIFVFFIVMLFGLIVSVMFGLNVTIFVTVIPIVSMFICLVHYQKKDGDCQIEDNTKRRKRESSITQAARERDAAITESIWGKKRDNETIADVKLMGVTSQCVDFKLHPILNYQEDIYANVYSFFVTYKSGKTKTIQTYKEKEINMYMSLINEFEAERSVSEPPNQESNNSYSVLEELERLKSLHESGIIPDDIFEKQRADMLDKLR